MMAKFWGAKHGLQLAWNMGFKNIILEFDSKVLTSGLIQNQISCQTTKALFLLCRTLLTQDWQVRIEHQYREGNKCADWLANHSLTLQMNLTIFRQPPAGI